MTGTASFNVAPTSGVPTTKFYFQDTSLGPTSDPYYAYVTLLAHFDGTHGSTSFIDNSGYQVPMYVNAGNPTLSNIQFIFAPTSLYCPDDLIAPGSVRVANTTNHYIFDSDFTIECWAYRIPSTWFTSATLLRKDFGTGYWLFRIAPDGFYHFDGYGLGGGFALTSTTPIATYDNQWANFAIVRSGATITLYINGVADASTTFSGIVGSTDPLVDGGQFQISEGSGREYWTGYIDEVRITKGIARYTTNFLLDNFPFGDMYGPGGNASATGWHWTFGDGTHSYIQNPIKQYSTANTFNTQLTTTFGSLGSDVSLVTPIAVTGIAPTLNVTWLPQDPVDNQIVTFTALWSGNAAPTSWSWWTNNGGTSTTHIFKHTFPAEGLYSISVHAMGDQFGDITEGPFPLYIGRSLPYHQAAPWSGMQFFDNAGIPLRNGLVNAYQANGFQKQNLYQSFSATETNIPNPFVLDNNGRMNALDQAQSVNMSVSYPYRFVASTSDGVVTQQLNDVYVPLLLPGNNITFRQRDLNANIVTIDSSTTDPLFDQGDPYYFTIASTQAALFTGESLVNFAVNRRSPTNPTTPVIVADTVNNAFKFMFDGAYEVTTNLTFSSTSWPSEVSVFGSKLRKKHETIPVNIAYDTSYNVLSEQKSVTNTSCVSMKKGQELEISTYAISSMPLTSKYSISGSVIITRIGEWF